jgi:hypothetical protein
MAASDGMSWREDLASTRSMGRMFAHNVPRRLADALEGGRGGLRDRRLRPPPADALLQRARPLGRLEGPGLVENVRVGRLVAMQAGVHVRFLQRGCKSSVDGDPGRFLTA